MKNNILKLSNLDSNTKLTNTSSGYDLIFLNDMMLEAEIGIYKKEKNITQPLRVSVVAKVKNPRKINDKNINSDAFFNI